LARSPLDLSKPVYHLLAHFYHSQSPSPSTQKPHSPKWNTIEVSKWSIQILYWIEIPTVWGKQRLESPLLPASCRTKMLLYQAIVSQITCMWGQKYSIFQGEFYGNAYVSIR
jgi:hypothetical protein